METPPCKKWAVWLGDEIEGFHDLGEKTIFVRDWESYVSLSDLDKRKAERIWLCAECIERMIDGEMLSLQINKLCIHYRKVCLDLPIALALRISNILLSKPRVRCYIRLGDLALDSEDSISFGLPYNETYIATDKMRTTTVKDYNEDIKII